MSKEFKHTVKIPRKMEEVDEMIGWLEIEGYKPKIDYQDDIKYRTANFSFKDPQKAFRFWCRFMCT